MAAKREKWLTFSDSGGGDAGGSDNRCRHFANDALITRISLSAGDCRPRTCCCARSICYHATCSWCNIVCPVSINRSAAVNPLPITSRTL